MLVIPPEPYHFPDSRVAGRVESEHNSVILLKTHKVLSHTQVLFSYIIQIMYSLQYYLFLLEVSRTKEP